MPDVRLLSLYSCGALARGIGPWNPRAFNLESLVRWAFGPMKLCSQMCTHRPSRWSSKLLSEVVTRCPVWKARMNPALINITGLQIRDLTIAQAYGLRQDSEPPVSIESVWQYHF